VFSLALLQGIRVLDLSRYLAGPFCGMLMADYGAEVIRIEPPGGADDRKVGPFGGDQSLGVLTMNRNKRFVTLNLKAVRGREIFLDLVRNSDVLIENFPAGTMERWGLGYEALSKINPGIVMVRVTGFGQTGPRAGWLAFDAIAQAMTGHMATAGRPGDDPIKTNMSMVDYGTGAIAAFGAVSALLRRNATGHGEQIDASLYATSITFLESAMAEATLGQDRLQLGNRRPATAPTDLFRAVDGWVYISISTDSIWRNMARVMGQQTLLDDPRFKDNWSRKQHEEELVQLLGDWVAGRRAADIERELQENHVACARVLDVADLLVDSHATERQAIHYVEHEGVGRLPIPGPPLHLTREPGGVERPTQQPGFDNADVLGRLLNVKSDEIEALQSAGVI